ncbi:MAG: MCP four helix bundle domain-containing protein [Sedimentisphaerales bacterium]|nr:MCP four helix bundle domain-containing protein [Sedimentisphaerales bacterium]
MFKQMTIGKKIALGFTAILLLTAILAVIGITQIKNVQTGVEDISAVHIPLTGSVTAIDAAATNQNLQVSLYAIHKEETQLEAFNAGDEEVDQALEQAKTIINSDEELVQLGWLNNLKDIEQAHDSFVSSCRKFIEVIKDETSDTQKIQEAADVVEESYTSFMDKVDAFLAANDSETNDVSQGAQQAAVSATLWIMIVSVAALITGSLLAFVIARGIVKTLKRIINSLSEGSEQVSSASSQVSTASQSLAEGATEQAAGLEETSSSLEEMSSMTKQNANNAQQANSLASEARTAAEKGNQSMARMTDAISQIQNSADETAKIIKVIDEIAFQTNLLALNAAVEAARAGEAGKGFAVVAEEVRNLAMRSAEAAKNTAALIEGSVKNSQNGVEITSEVAKMLEEIVTSVTKTTDLVSEIAAASQEQAQGIDQVNTAMSQMDKVTQQNAANAEESASASEELNAQAEQMNSIVGELMALVGGSSDGQTRSNVTTKEPQRTRGLSGGDHVFHHIAGAKAPAQRKTSSTHPVAPSHRTAKASLPLEGDDFDEFSG